MTNNGKHLVAELGVTPGTHRERQCCSRSLQAWKRNHFVNIETIDGYSVLGQVCWVKLSILVPLWLARDSIK